MKLIDLTGQRFGRLLVIEKIVDLTKKNNRTFWVCRCDCGREVKTWGPQLRGSRNRLGQTQCKPCRDLEFREYGKRLHSPETAITYLIGRYARMARVKDREFSLTRDQVRAIVTSPCHYCGAAPFMVYKKHSKGTKYTGLDRVDNSKGYRTGNVVPCCKICNVAKATLTREEFLNWLRRAYEHNYGKHN